LTFKKSQSFGLNLKPGIVVGKETPFLIHLIGGIEYAKWKIKDHFNVRDQSDVVLRSNKGLMGLNVGVGMASIVSKGVSVGLNFTHTFYKKTNLKGDISRGRTFQDGGELKSNFKPKETRVMASITKYL
jgi:opacity protein-like surface antigen